MSLAISNVKLLSEKQVVIDTYYVFKYQGNMLRLPNGAVFSLSFRFRPWADSASQHVFRICVIETWMLYCVFATWMSFQFTTMPDLSLHCS